MLDANGRANPFGDPNYLPVDGVDPYPPVTYTDTTGPIGPTHAGFTTNAEQPQVVDLRLAAGLGFFCAALFAGHTPPLPAENTWTDAAPPPSEYSRPELTGTGFFQAALPNLQGQTVSAEYTFGVHAATLYNAEAEKGDYWTPLSKGATPVIGAYASAAPPQADDLLLQPAFWPAVPKPPVVVTSQVAPFIAAAPAQLDNLRGAIQAALFAGATPTLGAVAYARPADPPPLPSYAWPATNAGPGILGAFVNAPPVQEALKQTPPPSLSVPLTAGPGILGAFVAGAPQEPPKQTPPVWRQVAAVAGPGFLGSFATVAAQDQRQPPAQLQSALPTPPVITTGILGVYVTVAAQDQRQPPALVQAALLAGARPTTAPFTYAPGQPPEYRGAWIAQLPASGRIGAFPITQPQLEFRASFIWSPVSSGKAGAFVAAAAPREASQPAPWIQRAALAPLGGLGAFLETVAQDQSQVAARTWSAIATPPPPVSGFLGRFAYVAEQLQDRPTVGVWVSVRTPPPVPPQPGVPFTIRAFAVSQFQLLPVARTAFLEASAGFVIAQYYAADGSLFVPEAVSYRIDDVASGQELVPWTALEPAMQNMVTVTAAQNQMVSLSRQYEAHQVLFMVTESAGIVDFARVIFDVVRTVGSV